jgi:exosome complex RNA-binding protein Csl4
VAYVKAGILSPVKDFVDLKTIGPCLGVVRAYGRTSRHHKVIIVGWLEDGRARSIAGSKADSKQKKQCALLYCPCKLQ